MNKTLLIVVAVVVVVLGIVVVFSQVASMPTANPAPLSQMNAGKPAIPAPTPVSAAVSAMAKVSAASIADLVKAWYAKNNKSYAGFMSNPANMQAMAKVFPKGQSMAFFVNSTKSHFVVRTRIQNDPVIYCTDDGLANVQGFNFVDDAGFRANVNCAGKAL